MVCDQHRRMDETEEFRTNRFKPLGGLQFCRRVGDGHHKRIAGKSYDDHLTAITRYRAAVADLLG